MGPARADGDPASDTLVFTNAFLPAHAPSKANADALRAEIAAAYSAGYRVKVAVIAARYDLGAIPSLFGKPATYARFLGEELAGIYVGPLLIVMPSGYGIYDGGRTTAAESAVLAALAKPASTKPDDLTGAATAAVGELLKRGALRSRDILPPYVEMVRAAAVGTQLKVLYYLSDDSGKASAKLEILRGGKQLFAAQEPDAPDGHQPPGEQDRHRPVLRLARAHPALRDRNRPVRERRPRLPSDRGEAMIESPDPLFWGEERRRLPRPSFLVGAMVARRSGFSLR